MNDIIYLLASLGLSGKESTCNARDTGRSLGREDPLEKEMAMHSSILAWRIPWTESLVGYSLCNRKEQDMIEQLIHSTAYVQLNSECCFYSSFQSMISVKIPSSLRRRNRELLPRSRCWGTSNSLENLESLILFMNLSFISASKQ